MFGSRKTLAPRLLLLLFLVGFALLTKGSLMVVPNLFKDLGISNNNWQQVLGAVTNLALEPESTLLPLPATASSELVKVTAIVDGDTIKISTGETVRYIGMDTPETKHPTKGVECFGKEATQRNIALVLNQEVRLEKDVSNTDRYGRLLRYVWLGDRLINEELVSEGYAHAASYPPDIARQKQLREAEQRARTKKLGLWSSCEL